MLPPTTSETRMTPNEHKLSIANYPIYWVSMAIVFAASLRLMPHLML